jgi:hypothetical protein
VAVPSSFDDFAMIFEFQTRLYLVFEIFKRLPLELSSRCSSTSSTTYFYQSGSDQFSSRSAFCFGYSMAESYFKRISWESLVFEESSSVYSLRLMKTS